MKLENIINMVKNLDDYLDVMEQKYNHIPREELRIVLEYGFYTYYMLTKKGADINVRTHLQSAYCGYQFLDNYKRVLYNTAKLQTKLRLKYKYAQEEYDGAYYFGLNDEEWEDYQSQISSKRNKEVTFTNIWLHKIKEEIFNNKSKKYFFILNYPIDVGWFFQEKEITTRSFKHFASRNAKGKIVTI